jgi:hypothetical protein
MLVKAFLMVLVSAGLAWGQPAGFQNLGFESAIFVSNDLFAPGPGSYPSVDPVLALPNWTALSGTNPT